MGQSIAKDTPASETAKFTLPRCEGITSDGSRKWCLPGEVGMVAQGGMNWVLRTLKNQPDLQEIDGKRYAAGDMAADADGTVNLLGRGSTALIPAAKRSSPKRLRKRCTRRSRCIGIRAGG